MSIQLIVESPRQYFARLGYKSDQEKFSALLEFMKLVEMRTISVQIQEWNDQPKIFDLILTGLDMVCDFVETRKPDYYKYLNKTVYLHTTDLRERFEFQFRYGFSEEMLIMDVGDMSSLENTIEWASANVHSGSENAEHILKATLQNFSNACALARRVRNPIFVSY